MPPRAPGLGDVGELVVEAEVAEVGGIGGILDHGRFPAVVADRAELLSGAHGVLSRALAPDQEDEDEGGAAHSPGGRILSPSRRYCHIASACFTPSPSRISVSCVRPSLMNWGILVPGSRRRGSRTHRS